MPTARTLLRLAEQADREAERARKWLESGRKFVEDCERSLAAHLEQAERFRRMAATQEDLHTPRDLSILDNNPMDDSHRLAISRGRASSNVDPDFKSAYRSKGYTLTTLAAAVGCDAPLMSKYRRKLRRIPQDRAEHVARLIPWPADKKHWPGGIVPKD